MTHTPKVRTLLFVLFLACTAAVQALNRLSQEQLLDTLDKYIARQAHFDKLAQERISQKVAKLPGLSPEKRQLALEDVAMAYTHVNIDSAMSYLDLGDSLAKERGDEVARLRLSLDRYQIYPLMSMVHDALEHFGKIDPKDVPAEVKLMYFSAGSQIYMLAIDTYRSPAQRREYANRAEEMLDSLINYTRPGSIGYIYSDSRRRLAGVEGPDAVAELVALLQKIRPDDYLYARMAADIAGYYLNAAHNIEQAKYYLTLSAIGDVMTGNAETTSLHRLGKILYDQGDDDRAYTYLMHSLDRSVKSGARIRALEIAETLPVVLTTADERESRNKRLLIIVVVALTALALTLILLTRHFYVHRQRLARLHKRLAQSLDVKDEYIRQILSLCGVYLTELENFSRLAGRKIKAKQYADLLDMIESGKIMHNQVQTFYTVFDSAFLLVYPNFTAEVAKLFTPGNEPVQPAEGQLNTDLRLLAFMHLGIDDSGEIAKFLGLSVNTVYTYRNKLKSRARNRANFEAEVRNLGKIR